MRDLLKDFADNFKSEIDKEYFLAVNFHLRDSHDIYYVNVVEGDVQIGQGEHDQAVGTFVTDERTLRSIHGGRLYALTAAGKALASEVAPLDFVPSDKIDLPP